MTEPTESRSRYIRVATLATVLYALLSGYFSYVGGAGPVVIFLCMAPYLVSAWVLIFAAPAVSWAGFAVGATAVLALFGALIISSTDPKVGQMWWLHLFSVPIAAVGAGLAVTYLNRWFRIKSEFAGALGAAVIAGLLPYTIIAVIA